MVGAALGVLRTGKRRPSATGEPPPAVVLAASGVKVGERHVFCEKGARLCGLKREQHRPGAPNNSEGDGHANGCQREQVRIHFLCDCERRPGLWVRHGPCASGAYQLQRVSKTVLTKRTNCAESSCDIENMSSVRHKMILYPGKRASALRLHNAVRGIRIKVIDNSASTRQCLKMRPSN